MADAAAIAKANEPVPDMVKQFVAYFYRHIREKNVYETLSMYEKSFGAISERYFKASAWPSVEAIAKYADDDHVFCLLYKEMYFRHVYGKATPTLEQRRESWDNYANLFSVITHGNVNMQLPNLWLWEMIDEFIYQFQSFCQFRGKLSGKTKEELKALDECDAKGVWAADAVLNFLAQMAERSGIAAALEAERAGTMKFSETEGYDYAASNVLRTLGYFSLIGTARVRILLGDYESALRALDPIDLDAPGLFTKVAGASVSTAYHVGFAYFMLGRYTDAARHFNRSLVFVNRHKVAATRPYALDLLLKKQEQMYAACAMAVILGGNGSSNGGASADCAARLLEEGVAGALREKHGDDMARMAQGVVSAFDEAFSFACPKFVTPGGPPAGATRARATPPTTTRRRTGRSSSASSRRCPAARSSPRCARCSSCTPPSPCPSSRTSWRSPRGSARAARGAAEEVRGEGVAGRRQRAGRRGGERHGPRGHRDGRRDQNQRRRLREAQRRLLPEAHRQAERAHGGPRPRARARVQGEAAGPNRRVREREFLDVSSRRSRERRSPPPEGRDAIDDG